MPDVSAGLEIGGGQHVFSSSSSARSLGEVGGARDRWCVRRRPYHIGAVAVEEGGVGVSQAAGWCPCRSAMAVIAP
jgi:hypothetical protein